MMLTVTNVAKQCGLENGYRVVTDSGKHCSQKFPNLYMHVIGGQQLHWPPTLPEQSKEEDQHMECKEETKSEVLKQINP